MLIYCLLETGQCVRLRRPCLPSRASPTVGIQVLARIVGLADAEQHPVDFTTSPALVIPRALTHAHMNAADVDLYEINEAFSVVDIVNRQLLGLDDER